MAIRNGFLFKCIQAGTSGTTEPNWIDCGVGSTLNDGTCIWLNCGSALVIYSGGQTIDSLQPAQAGADVTGQHTSNDTAKVSGTPSGNVALAAVTGSQVNLIPDSGLKSTGIYWPTKSGTLSITKNIDNVNNCIEYVGTGSASGYTYLATIPFTVTPGTYTLSANGWVNNVTSGNPVVVVFNPAITTAYGQLTLTANGRQSAPITIPAGVTSVVILFDTNTCTVANGQGCGVQQIQLEQGSVMTAYKENIGDQNAGTLGIDFNNTIHLNKNLSNIADSSTRLAWLSAQQESLIQTPSRNYVLDPYFRNVNSFWTGGSAIPTVSGSSVTFGTAAASTYYTAYNEEGHGNFLTVPVYSTDTIILELTCTQAGTGTTDTYLALDFRNAAGTHVGYGAIHANVAGTFTDAAPVPAGATYAYIYLQTYGGASGGNGAYIANPKIRINHETSSDPNGLKAYANLNDNTPGGHTGPSYALGDTVTGAIQASATPVLDGGIVTFQVPFSTQPEVLWLDGGCGFSESQYQQFTETFTQSGGQYTGFTASLKIVTPAGSPTNESVNFSGGSATVTIPGGDSVVNGSFTASGSVENPDGESNVITVTLDDATNGVSASKNYTIAAKSTKAFSITMTDATITNGQTMTLSFSSGGSASGTPTLTYQVQTTPTLTSATPPGFPGVNWIAFATS